MVSCVELEGRFEKRFRSRPISYSAEIGDDGLVLGAGTVLAHMGRDEFGSPALALEKSQDRLLALLSAAQGRPASPEMMRHLQEASDHWRRGDKALANIRMAFAGIPRLDEPFDAYRLFLAEELLGAGMSPGALMKGLGFDAPGGGLAKFDPNQQRIPAGNGRVSGRWGLGGGGAQDSATARTVLPPAAEEAARAVRTLRAARGLGTLGQGLFEATEGSPFLAGLARLAAGAAGPFVTLGAIFIPTPAGRISQGAIPGEPDMHYFFDEPAGALRLYRQGENGRKTIAAAIMKSGGIFVDSETGEPVARFVNGNLLFDAESLAGDAPDRRAKRETDEPKLCPAPSKDVGHGASERAIAYQAQISRLNNPRRPLPPGMAVRLNNPETGKDVVFDDCRLSDGTMIEAKGPGYADMLKDPFFSKMVMPEDWRDQGERQVAAAGPRDIEWYFAERQAAESAEKIFEGSKKLHKIKIYVVPAEVQ